MTCKTCGREIPGAQLVCTPCLNERSRVEIRKLVLESAMMADFYGFKDQLHIFDKAGRELSSSPGKRVAWCGAKPRMRGQTALADVTFATRTMLSKISGVCKECLRSV